jgi:glycosyltransferase involved in cell wall biosynthesis
VKILELCLSPDLGGLELYMYRCARELSRSHEVLSVVAADGRLPGYLNRDGLALEQLQRGNKALPLRTARRLAGIIDREGVDLLHVHWGKDLALAALAKRFSRRKPKLVYTRQMQITRPKRDFYHNFLFGQVDRIITITRALAEDMQRFLNPAYAERITPLYYGVPAPEQALSADERAALRAEMGVAGGMFLVGLFGRIKHYKGQHLLVEAVTRARASGLNIGALIVGRAMEEEYLADLKHQVRERGLEQAIVFKDFVDNPQALMRACDAVALTTIEETFGLVLVEAMRAGVAVVGSDKGGVPEIIDHGHTGLLFKSGDAADLADQLGVMSQDPDLLARLALSGKAKADRLFDEASHFRELEKIISRTAMAQELISETAR